MGYSGGRQNLLQKMLILVCREFRRARGHDRIRGGDVGWRLGPVPKCERLDPSLTLLLIIPTFFASNRRLLLWGVKLTSRPPTAYEEPVDDVPCF